jgi:putative spermidine/putrescine transport system permease protein
MTTATLIESDRSGGGLARRLRRAERLTRLRAFLLVLPLLLFVLVMFVLPIGQMLFRSVDNTAPCRLVPETCQGLQRWDGTGLPDEALYAAFARELAERFKDKTADQLGTRLNYEASGMLSLVRSTARRISQVTEGPYRPAFEAIDPRWVDHAVWAMIKQALVPYTAAYYLNALDLKQDSDGNVVAQPADQQIYVALFLRTFWIGLVTTGICLLLGYPVAHLLAHVPPALGNRLLILVLLPFWTSLLVRTTAWFVLLQDNGAVNSAIMSLGLSEEPLKLIFSRAGTIIAMTHIQLPFTLLPIYSVMKGIPPAYMRAARSLGAGPVYAFRRIYMPQTLPGIAAGCLLTFILCLGYYITPALVGGPSDQMISGLIAEAMNRESNWGKASAMGAILLSATMALFFIYNRLVGIDKVKLG